jgi:hypothetical protein
MQIERQTLFFVDVVSQKLSDALNNISLTYTIHLLEISKVFH